jgi:hypothetical protein
MKSTKSESKFSCKFSGTLTKWFRYNLADRGFESLIKYVHPLIQKNSIENDPTFYNKILGRKGPVRIAILDTGIKLPVPDCWAYESRIMEYQSWVGGGSGLSNQEDLEGHGTHSAGLLLRVSPDAEIYVARVFVGKGDSGGGIPSDTVNSGVAKVNYDVSRVIIKFLCY